MIIRRRSFLAGLGSMLAAPAIVHAGNLMPVKALPKVPVAVALPKNHVAVLAVSAEGVHVLPVPKKVIEKTGWEKFLNWAGFDAG